MVTANEFSHVVKISEVGNHSRNLRLSADEAARHALMARFTASLAQFCIATHDPVPAKLDETIHIQFIAEPTSNGEVELELAPEDCDTMFHDGQTIDLGEAVAQSMGLALNPYPRSPEAEKILKAAGVKSEEDVAPVGALAGLKDLLAKK